MLRRKTAMLVALVSVASALAACGSGDNEATGASGSSSMPLKVGYYPGLIINLPLLYAEQAGLYKKHGLDVKLVGIGNGPGQMAANSNGSTDIFSIAGGAPMVANTKGQTFTAVTGLVDQQIYMVIAQKGLPQGDTFSQKMQAAKGKRFGITALGSDDYMVARTLISAVGMNPDKDATLLPGGDITAKIAAFKSGQVQYQVMTEPGYSLLTTGSDAPGVTVADTRQAFDGNPFVPWIGQAMCARKSVIGDKAKAFEAFNKAIAEANEYVSDPAHLDQLVPILAKDVKIDPVILKTAIKNTQSGFSSDITCDAVSNIGEWAVKTGQIKQDQIPSCKDFVWKPKQ